MQITALETFQVAPRWLFLKVSTDEGIAGWGEPIVEGKADTVAACVEEMSHLLSARTRWRSRRTGRCSSGATSTGAARC